MKPLSSKKVVRALTKAGFVQTHLGKGRHAVFVRRLADGSVRRTIVQLGAREIPPGVLSAILRQTGLSEQEFLIYAKLLKHPRRGR